MEAEKIFCKTCGEFCKDNNMNINKFYNNIENARKYYGLDISSIKKKKPTDSGSIEKAFYRIHKLSEPLLTLMIENIVENKIKNNNSDLTQFPLNTFLNYNKSLLGKIDNLPFDLSLQIMDSPTYEYNFITTEYLNTFISKINEILNLVMSFNILINEDKICDILCHLNDILDLLKKENNKLDNLKYEYEEVHKEINNIKSRKKFDDMSDEVDIHYIELNDRESEIEQEIYSYNSIQNKLLLDNLLKEEFHNMVACSKKLNHSIKDDKFNKLCTCTGKTNSPHIQHNENIYELTKSSKRHDIFFIDKDELFSCLYPKKTEEEIINIDSLDYLNLIDFINFYKKNGLEQLKNSLCSVEESDTKAIYNTYYDISMNTLKKIDLVKKYFERKIYYSNKLNTLEFKYFKYLINFMVKSILNLNVNNSDLAIFNSKYPGISINYKIIYDLLNSNEIKSIKNNCTNESTKIVDIFLLIYNNKNIIDKVYNSIKLYDIKQNSNNKSEKQIFNISENIKINISHLHTSEKCLN